MVDSAWEDTYSDLCDGFVVESALVGILKDLQ
jgi:hypothetical protein